MYRSTTLAQFGFSGWPSETAEVWGYHSSRLHSCLCSIDGVSAGLHPPLVVKLLLAELTTWSPVRHPPS